MSYLTVKRRQIRTRPLYDDETGEQIGWYTTHYSYDGLENEKGFKTKKEAIERRRQLEMEMIK